MVKSRYIYIYSDNIATYVVAECANHFGREVEEWAVSQTAMPLS